MSGRRLPRGHETGYTLSFRVESQAAGTGKEVASGRRGRLAWSAGQRGAGSSYDDLGRVRGRCGLPEAILAQECVEQAGQAAQDSDEGELVGLAVSH